VEEASKRVNVKGVIGDGAYDSRRNFNLLDERGVEPIIKVRRNAVERLRGCPARRKALIMQRSGSEGWRRKYGLRMDSRIRILVAETGLRGIRSGQEPQEHDPNHRASLKTFMVTMLIGAKIRRILNLLSKNLRALTDMLFNPLRLLVELELMFLQVVGSLGAGHRHLTLIMRKDQQV